MPKLAIVTENLTRDFGAVRAVDHLSLEVRMGAIFGFLGPNGAGKTTTVRLLLGLLEPTSGRAQVLGFDTHREAAEIRNRTGALLEFSGLYDRLSAYDNLDYYGRIWRLSSPERAARIDELLHHFDLWDRRLEAVDAWSHGMRRKLAIARALLHRPALVFLDEPTSGLDPVAAAALRKELASLSSSEGVTIFLSTHNLLEAEQLCDQVAVIRRGQLIAKGRPSELRSQPSAQQVEVYGRGFSDTIVKLLLKRNEVLGAHLNGHSLLLDLQWAADTAPLVSLLVESGVDIEEVRKQNMGLEAAFMTLMEDVP